MLVESRLQRGCSGQHLANYLHLVVEGNSPKGNRIQDTFENSAVDVTAKVHHPVVEAVWSLIQGRPGKDPFLPHLLAELH